MDTETREIEKQANYSLFSVRKVNLSPCVVECVDEANGVFIVGTYQLIENEECSENVNNRRGSLLLFKSDELIFEHSCEDGGVFDLKVVKEPNLIQFFVAHSNGVLAVYCFQDDNQIKIVNRTQTNSSLLTCLYPCLLPSKSNVVTVGDSSGFLRVYVDMQFKSEMRASKHEYPIWTTHVIPLSAHELLIVLGSDDAFLRFNYFRCDNSHHKTILENSDALSGITAINMTLERKEDNRFDAVLYVGSYDENIRIYDLCVELDQTTDCEPQIKCTRKKSIKVDGGGIWRIHLLPTIDGILLLIAGMFSGVHFVKEGSIILTLDKFENNEQQLKEVDADKHLIYGVAAVKERRQLIVASFYTKEIYFFKR